MTVHTSSPRHLISGHLMGRYLIGATAVGLLLASCGSSSKSASTTPGPTTTASAARSSSAATTVPATSDSTGDVQLVDSSLGTILADAKGDTLYMFVKDTGGKSACSGDCAKLWTAFTGPVTTPGNGLDAGDFATITRDDGTKQVTFYGHPLYQFNKDATPGDINGQGVGGNWFVVDAEGNGVGVTAPSTTTAG